MNFDKVFTSAKPWTSMSLGPTKRFQKLNALAGASRALEVLRLYQDIQVNFDKVFTLAKPWTSMRLGPDKTFQKLNAVAGASKSPRGPKTLSGHPTEL